MCLCVCACHTFLRWSTFKQVLDQVLSLDIIRRGAPQVPYESAWCAEVEAYKCSINTNGVRVLSNEPVKAEIPGEWTSHTAPHRDCQR